jgi:hypothetical protein
MYFFRENIYPNIYAFLAQRKIKRRIEQLKQKGLNLVIPDSKELDLDEFNKELEEYRDSENDRKKVIDDKAKSSLFVVTLSITVILAGLNFIKDGKVTFRPPLLLLMIVGVAYFVLSAITAVRALNVREFYTLGPDDWIDQAQEQPTVMSLQKLTRVKMLYAAVKANELTLNIKTNFVDATFIGIRNGIILLSLAFIIAVGNIGNQVQFSDPPKSENLGQSSSKSDSKQEQTGESPALGINKQETTVSNNTQSGVVVPKNPTNNSYNINSH